MLGNCNMSNSGKPFDAQEELRIGGRASALQILLSAAAKGGNKVAAKLAERALSHIEAQVAKEQGLPECPEAWLTGMHDIEQALRQSIDTLTGRLPE